MAWGAIAGLALSAVQASENSKNYARQVELETQGKIAGINASKDAFAADIDALIIQNFINEELAANAIVEAERAGGANLREAQVEIKKAESQISARNDGITAGASKARELTSFYVQASKEVNKTKDQTTSQIIKIADSLDNTTNELNAKAQQSYDNMRLAIAGVSSYSSIQAPSIAANLSNAMKGVQMGSQFETNINNLRAPNG